MPVIITSQEAHPFLPSLGNPAAIAKERALTQDVRPIEIAILNLMADKQTTERQLARWLGATALQVQVTFVATDSYVDKLRNGYAGKNTSPDHIQKFYYPFSEINDRKFDGLIITGVNALKDRVEDEIIWSEVCDIFNWSRSNVFSSLFLCWGAKAALKFFYNIDSIKGQKKTFGLFEHRLLSDKTGVMFGFPDVFPVPVSRWKSPDPKAILSCPELEIVADCQETGPNMIVEPSPYEAGEAFFPRRVYVLNHPEYDTDTLKREYERDVAASPSIALPVHYYPKDDAAQPPVNTWRYTAMLYANWVRSIYASAPFDISQVPLPYKA